jgi:raffinose/stachyose/melibiose transport system permease protein
LGRSKFKLYRLLLYLFLACFCFLIISPLLIVFSSSLCDPSNISSPLQLFNQISLASYGRAFEKMQYPTVLLNSILTTSGSVLIIVLIASMAAYPISRVKTKMSRGLYYFFIAGLIVPSQMVVVPVAQMFGRLNIPNNRFTPMIMFITCSLPFSAFLYAGFMKSVPVEIEESAYMDGANLIVRFFRFAFPLIKPATVSVVITQGMWIWNDYFYPMIFITKRSQYSIPVAMLQFLGDRENPAQWSVLFASCVLCAIPLILVFAALQKQFVNGIVAGAIKG